MARVHWNDAGIKQVLNSPRVAAFVDQAAEALADRVRADGSWDRHVEGIPGDTEMPVRVSNYTSDRPRASVHLAHPSGLAVQAKNGVLSSAAADLGLRVIPRKGG